MWIRIIPALLVALLLVSAPHPANASIFLGSSLNLNPLSSGLVGYWPLDGATTNWTSNTTRDLSGNGNTGQLLSMSTTTSPVAGKIGSALKFNGVNGTARNTSPSNLNIGNGTDYSFSVWAQTNSSAGGQILTFIKGSTNSNDQTGIYFSAGVPRGQLRDSQDGTSVEAADGVNKADGKWHHYVFTVTRNTSTGMKFYVDGTLVGTANPTSESQTFNTSSLNIGSYSGSSLFFLGTIDDVRIYNRALSAQEIALLHAVGQANVAHANTTALSSGLVGYWSMDGSAINWTKNQVSDLSGQGNTGQLISMSPTTSPVAGKIGGALKFDGSTSYLRTNSGLGVSTSATISVWVNTSRTEANTINYPVSLGSSGSIRLSLWVGGAFGDTQVANHSIGLTDGTNSSSAVANSFTTADYGKWHHIIVTYDSNATTKTVIYKDGVNLNMFSSNLTGVLASQNQVFIGKRADNFWYFPGSIDDVRVYNRALSAAEVKQLYALGGTNVAHSNTTALSSGLVGYWTLDGSKTNWRANTTQDSSGNGNTGTLINMSTTTSPVAGKIGQALKFNGSNQYVNAVHAISGNSPLTMVLWVKTSYSASRQEFASGGNGACGPGNGFLMYADTSGKLNFDYPCDKGPAGATTITDGAWHQVGIVKDATSRILYVDGKVDGSGAVSTMNVITNTFYIGRATYNNSNYTRGIIDDVRIYNRALSAQEISQLYQLGR